VSDTASYILVKVFDGLSLHHFITVHPATEVGRSFNPSAEDLWFDPRLDQVKDRKNDTSFFPC